MTFIRATVIRAVRTAAQSAIAAIGTTVLIQQVDWEVVLGTTGIATLLSVLTSLATGLPEAED